MESEEEARERLGNYYIPIWDGGDVSVSQAIKEFRERWKPYSTASRQYPVVKLIDELIDPALATYIAALSPRYSGHIPGVGTGIGLGGLVRLVGLDATVQTQRRLLRAFVQSKDTQSTEDRRFVATAESLIEVVTDCILKQPVRSTLRDKHGTTRALNARRRRGFCRFCGAPSELTVFADDEFGQRENGTKKDFLLSTQYCSEHRPKLKNGEWNHLYRQAKRSVSQFDIELIRLSRQCAKPEVPRANSGDDLVDSYIFHFVRNLKITLDDKATLRNLAHQMAIDRLSDDKKRILALVYAGYNQSEIARTLGIKTRQSVWKVLNSIPDRYVLASSGDLCRQPTLPISGSWQFALSGTITHMFATD